MQRRTYIKTVGAGSIAALAGCTGEGNGNNGGDNSTTGNGGNNEFTNTTLRVADSYPEGHYLRQTGVVPYTERVTEETNGQVTFEMFPGEQLGSAQELLDLLKSGSTDIAIVGPSYVSDQLPLSTVATVPGTYSSTEEGAREYWQLTQDFLYEEELSDHNVTPLHVSMLPPYQLATNNQVDSLSDMEGLSIRSGGGGMSRTIEELGATPVEMSGADVISSMESGVIDSVIFTVPSLPAYDMQTYLDYCTNNVHLAGWSAFTLIRDEALEQLNTATQDVFNTVSEGFSAEVGARIDEEAGQVREEISGEMEFYETEADSAMNQAIQPVYDHWSSNLDERGLPGSEVLDEWVSRFE